MSDHQKALFLKEFPNAQEVNETSYFKQYKCSLNERIIRGKLTITSKAIYFYSKMSGEITAIQLPFEDIASIEGDETLYGAVVITSLPNPKSVSYKFLSFLEESNQNQLEEIKKQWEESNTSSSSSSPQLALSFRRKSSAKPFDSKNENSLKSSSEFFDQLLDDKSDDSKLGLSSSPPITHSIPSITLSSSTSSTHPKQTNNNINSIADAVRIRSMQTQQSRLQSEAKIKSKYQSLKEATTPQPLSAVLSSSSPSSSHFANPYNYNFDQLNIIRRGACVYVSLLAGWFVMPNRIVFDSYRDLFSVTLLLVCLDFCIQPLTLVHPLSNAICILFLKKLDEKSLTAAITKEILPLVLLPVFHLCILFLVEYIILGFSLPNLFSEILVVVIANVFDYVTFYSPKA